MEQEKIKCSSGIKKIHIVMVGIAFVVLLAYSFYCQLFNLEQTTTYECSHFSKSIEKEIKQFFAIPDYMDIEPIRLIDQTNGVEWGNGGSSTFEFYTNKENEQIFYNSDFKWRNRNDGDYYRLIVTVEGRDYIEKCYFSCNGYDLQIFEDLYNQQSDIIVVSLTKQRECFGLGIQYKKKVKSLKFET